MQPQHQLDMMSSKIDVIDEGAVDQSLKRNHYDLSHKELVLLNIICHLLLQKATVRRGYPAMQPEHQLDVMSSKINVIDEDTADQSLKRNRYDSSSEDIKRRKTSHIDMDMSDGEDDAGSAEIIEIPHPPSEGDDGDIEEVGSICFLSSI